MQHAPVKCQPLGAEVEGLAVRGKSELHNESLFPNNETNQQNPRLSTHACTAYNGFCTTEVAPNT